MGGSLAILGTAPSRSQAPFHDKDITIWGVSGTQKANDVERVDVLFELHPKRYWGIPAVMANLKEFDGNVVMQDHYDDIPKSVAYPYNEVKERFYIPAMGANLYVTNTITWMMLKGILDGFDDFQLYGVHMEHETEYAYQQPNVAWAAGIIQGLGLRLYVAGESTLLKARFEYGFHEPTALMRAITDRQEALSNGVEQEKRKMTAAKENMLRTEGAMQEAEHWRKYVSGQK
jgi:hypothetical protein